MTATDLTFRACESFIIPTPWLNMGESIETYTRNYLYAKYINVFNVNGISIYLSIWKNSKIDWIVYSYQCAFIYKIICILILPEVKELSRPSKGHGRVNGPEVQDFCPEANQADRYNTLWVWDFRNRDVKRYAGLTFRNVAMHLRLRSKAVLPDILCHSCVAGLGKNR